MYKVKCTGKNLSYGKKDEIRLVADCRIGVGTKRNWFEVISYEGSGNPDSLFSLKRTLDSINRDMNILNLKKDMIERKIKTGKYV